MKKLISLVLGVAVFVVALFFGGWSLHWGGAFASSAAKTLAGFFSYDNAVLVKVGSGWYGFVMEERFFYIPWLQFTIFIVGFLFLVLSLLGGRKPKD
jgi:hypothetical protein